MLESQATLKEKWWPEIRDRETARKTARQAFWAAIVVIAVTLAFATLAALGTSVAGISPAAFVDAAIFGVIAIGIRRMSRVAAVAGLVLFVLERLLMLPENHGMGSLIVGVAITLAFANGVRATFAYHRFAAASPPPTEMPPLAPK